MGLTSATVPAGWDSGCCSAYHLAYQGQHDNQQPGNQSYIRGYDTKEATVKLENTTKKKRKAVYFKSWSGWEAAKNVGGRTYKPTKEVDTLMLVTLAPAILPKNLKFNAMAKSRLIRAIVNTSCMNGKIPTEKPLLLGKMGNLLLDHLTDHPDCKDISWLQGRVKLYRFENNRLCQENSLCHRREKCGQIRS